MLKTPLFRQTFILLLVIGFFDYLANKFFFYWTIWWFDMVMHFVAGICVGMTTILVWVFYNKNTEVNILKTTKVTIWSILFVGLLWEVYELAVGATSFSQGIGYVTDTSSDLILDVCGAVLGAVYAQYLVKKTKILS